MSKYGNQDASLYTFFASNQSVTNAQTLDASAINVNGGMKVMRAEEVGVLISLVSTAGSTGNVVVSFAMKSHDDMGWPTAGFTTVTVAVNGATAVKHWAKLDVRAATDLKIVSIQNSASASISGVNVTASFKH